METMVMKMATTTIGMNAMTAIGTVARVYRSGDCLLADPSAT